MDSTELRGAVSLTLLARIVVVVGTLSVPPLRADSARRPDQPGNGPAPTMELDAVPANAQETTAEEAAQQSPGAAPSKTKSMREKMERFFKIFPVPIVYYSSDTGTVVGLAKFNLFHLSKKDKVSPPSKAEEIVTVSAEGQFSVGAATTLHFAEDTWMYRGEYGYQDFPEYIFGIGNSVSVDDKEKVTTQSLTLDNQMFRRIAPSLYVGGVYNYRNYLDVEKEAGSFLDEQAVTGRDGGVSSGIGLSLAYDSRDNRYNARHGHYLHLTGTFYRSGIGSDFSYDDYKLDARTYFVPWLKHVCALQVYTGLQKGDVPYYSLQELGGPNRMRGYYEGALRDKAIIDGQLEYRMPIWSIIGIAVFAGAGRVAEDYSAMSFKDVRFSYGLGLRLMVDSENQTNLRVDFGFGPDYGPDRTQVRAFYIRFAEAF